MNKIASRHWRKQSPTFYVNSLPGHGGLDWGYTTDRQHAIPLSPYWQRRFAADCRRVGAEARFAEQVRLPELDSLCPGHCRHIDAETPCCYCGSYAH